MINLPTKFEVPNFTHYGYMKGVTNCRKFGGLGYIFWSMIFRSGNEIPELVKHLTFGEEEHYRFIFNGEIENVDEWFQR